MATGKNAFLLYHDIRKPLELLTDEERGKLLLAILDYSEFGTVPDCGGALMMAFAFIRESLDRDAEAWEGKRQKRVEAGSKGGKQTAANRANAAFADLEQQITANQAVPVPISEKEEKEKLCDDAFTRFWKAYPKKVGKQAALKAFKRVDVSVETLLTAIEQQKRGSQWSKDNGQYIPNPATWLNQGRWEDELVYDVGMAPDYYSDTEGSL